MNHSLYIYYLFVSYKLSVSMQIKRFLRWIAYFDTPLKSILKDLPLRSNSKSFYSFLFMVIIYFATGNKLAVS